MTMTLTSLLGIKLSLIRIDEDRGLQFAERVWESRGRPLSGTALVDTLESILTDCTESGVPYPRILLKRKKEIERGTWRPNPEIKASPETKPAQEGDEACTKCGGSGFVPIEGGMHVTFCECNPLHPSHKT